MKKYTLFVIVCLLSALMSKAQMNVYHPFPDSNAVWGMSTGCVEMTPGCYDWGFVKDYYAGDTIIGGKEYKIINEFILYMSNSSCCNPPGNSGTGYLRDDTAARKVYWRDPWMTSDSLLYDFNLLVGDTIRGYLSNSICASELVIQSIDSILIGTTYRKRFNIDTSNFSSAKLSIIEGIGSTRGLTQLFYQCPFGTSLNCFSVDDNVIYSDPNNPDSTPCGSLTVNLNQFSASTNSAMNVFPNPAQETITVKTQSRVLPMSVSIYSMQGDLILEKQIQSDNCVIDISALPPGIYFIEARGDIVLQGRFVKE